MVPTIRCHLHTSHTRDLGAWKQPPHLLPRPGSAGPGAALNRFWGGTIVHGIEGEGLSARLPGEGTAEGEGGEKQE